MKLFSIIVMALVLFSCEKKDECEYLQGSWQFISIENIATSQVELFPDSIGNPIILIFDNSQVLSINGICNQGFGEYSCSENKLIISGISLTEMACISGNTWENYLYELNSVSGFDASSSSLSISSSKGYRLNFQRVELE